MNAAARSRPRWRPALATVARGCLGGMSDARLRRWRLVLGGDEAEGTGVRLGKEDQAMDGALDAVYGSRSGGLGGSAPTVARWLGELRSHFPSGVVRVVQQDAIDRLGLHRLLLEPEVLESVTPDVNLAATLMSLKDALPEASRTVARRLVREVVQDIERRLADRTRAAARGALDRSARTSRPRPAEIDWDRTIKANLKHYLPEHKTVIPERLVGHARKKRSLAAELILALDQSGSMASSVVHAGRARGVARLAADAGHEGDRLRHLDRRPDRGARRSRSRCCSASSSAAAPTSTRRSRTARTSSCIPAKTVLILVTDLYEGGDPESMLRRAASLLRSGVRLIVLLALSDDGTPAYEHRHAAAMAALGAPVFACTPDQFPEMLAAALEGRDVRAWAAAQDIAVELVQPRGAAASGLGAHLLVLDRPLELLQRPLDVPAHDRRADAARRASRRSRRPRRRTASATRRA